MNIRKIVLSAFVILFMSVFLVAGNASALTLGTNITVYDKNSSAETGWYGKGEDQEVEPGMAQYQKWDLEGFYKNGSTLTMVGGYNFAKGEAGNGTDWWDSGDIFFDMDGDAVFGDIPGTDGNDIVANTFGYDYAIDLEFIEGKDGNWTYNYTLYQQGQETTYTETAYYADNQGSSPWQIASGWEAVGTRSFNYFTGKTDSEVGGLEGGFHNAVVLDLTDFAFLMNDFDFVHFTMGCGNDNLMGANTVPEPATMLLLGALMIGLAVVGRKKTIKTERQ